MPARQVNATPGADALGVTKGLYPKHGDRVMDTPLSESAYIGAAIGAAACGMRPVAELMFLDFMGVCFDQILQPSCEVQIHVRRQGNDARGDPRHGRSRFPRSGPALANAHADLYARAGTEGRVPVERL